MPPTENFNVTRRALDLEDYIDVARRHKGWIAGPVFAGIVISCIIAFLLPNVYISSASLRIAPAQIAEPYVPAAVSQQMADRINQMEQDILSSGRLSQLIQRPDLNLYKSERDRLPLDDVIENMRQKDIKISIMNVSGAAGRPASAFRIQFAYADRAKAQAVVQALVTNFMEANVNSQRTTNEVTGGFLQDETKQAKVALDAASDALTQFRVQNPGRLPEQSQFNVQALNGLQSERSSLDGALNRDAQEKLLLESRLDTAKNQYETTMASAPIVNDDPAVASRNERITDLNRRITETESRLASLREVYKDTYPDIRNYEQQIQVWRKERDGLQKEAEKSEQRIRASGKRTLSPALGSAMANLQATIETTKAGIRAVDLDRQEKLRQLENINRQIASYQSRLEQGPANEQRYAQLLKDYEIASKNYQDMVQKSTLAQAHRELVSRKAGEQLEVLDPATLPEQPTSPNRWLICGIGLVTGLVAGVGLAGIREMKDTSLKNLKDVRAYTQMPILSSIPLLENDMLVQRRRRLTYLAWSAAVIVGVLAASVSMYYHYFVART